MGAPTEHVTFFREDENLPVFPLLQHASVGFASVDLQGNYLHANPRLCEIAGYTEEELLRMNVWDLTHPDDREKDQQQMKDLIAGKIDAHSLEKRYLRKDGSIRWIHLSAILVRDPQGQPAYMLGIVEDIMPRKQVEEDLRRSEERLRLVINAAHDGYWDVDMSNNTAYFSDPFYEIMGLSRQDFSPTAENFWPYIHPDDCPTVSALYEAHVRDPQIRYDIEFRLRHASGEYRYCHSRGEAIRHPDGTPYRMVGLITDITARKKAEEELRLSEILLSDFFENATIGLHWLGPDGTILRANKALLEMLGYTPEEYVGQHFSRFHVDPEAAQEILTRQWNHEELDSCPTRLKCKDGTVRSVLISANVYWEQSEFIHSRCFIKDITDFTEALHAAVESEDRFRMIADAAPVLICMADRHGDAIYFNRQCLELTGLPMEELLKYNWVHVLHPEDQKRFYQLYMDAFDNHQPFQDEFRLRRHDGMYRWFQITGQPRFDLKGEFAGYVSALVDITEHRQAESRLRRIVDANVIGILFWDKTGRVTDANNKLLDLIGYSREDLQNGLIDWRQLTPPEFLPLDEAALSDMLATGSCPLFGKQYFHKDGHRIDLLVGGVYFRDSIEEGVAFVLDISECNRLEKAFNSMVADLKPHLPTQTQAP